MRPLVFLPGLLCDAALWRAQVEALRDRAAPMVADLTLDDSIAAMAARTLAAAPARFALVALSMGGYVAFEMLRQAPDRIERVALIATSAAPDSPARAEERRRGIASLAKGRFVGVTQRLLPQLVTPDRVDGPIGEAVQAMALRVGGVAFLRQQTAILGRIDSRASLEAIRVPTLVAVGEQDRLTPPAEAETIARGIPGARLHRIADCGHLPPMEQAEATSALLRDWLPG